MNMDLTDYGEILEPIATKKILSCVIRMDKKTMLQALMSEKVLIGGYMCKVPEHEILMLLINKTYGETKLEWEIIDKNE